MKLMARVNIDLPDEVHRQAKAAAALRGISLKDFVVAALKDAVKREGRGK